MVQSSTAFIGMDVHKDSIDVAIADAREARHFGRVGGDAAAVDRVVRKLRSVHRRALFVYEAGPCGFWLYRRLRAQGLECMVVSPSKTPRNDTAILAELEHWRWRPVVEALQGPRGVQVLHAVRIVAELGDFNRFESPRKLMAYLGLIPSENSSGARRLQGAITKAGNSSARRAFVEAAHAYAHPARLSWVIARRQTRLSKNVCDIAWQAQLRLCARFRRLAARRVPRNKVIVAVARELCGFAWAIARDVKPAA